MNPIKKTVYTLACDGYSPEICEITFPYLKRYADKIGADFFVIRDRRFPDAPPTYEKLQIYELAEERQDDWSFFFDADCLVHPWLPDVTAFAGKHEVILHGTNCSANAFRPNKYFLRDGRMQGTGNWFNVVSDWCRDFWRPLDIPLEAAIKEIFPSPSELRFGLTPGHFIDEYMTSLNLARFGLKVKRLTSLGPDAFQAGMMQHHILLTGEEKVRKLKEALTLWGLSSVDTQWMKIKKAPCYSTGPKSATL
jgi:hypothetical protein